MIVLGSVLEKVKDIIGVEGTVKEVFVPALNFTSANITLGGAGYPIGQFHQQFLAYVEGLDTEQAGRKSPLEHQCARRRLASVCSEHRRSNVPERQSGGGPARSR